MSHTPGPWEMCADGTLRRAAGDKSHIGYFEEAPDMKRCGERNTYLITAAPELLAALKNLLARDMTASHSMWPEVQTALEVIAKVEGLA